MVSVGSKHLKFYLLVPTFFLVRSDPYKNKGTTSLSCAKMLIQIQGYILCRVLKARRDGWDMLGENENGVESKIKIKGEGREGRENV